MTLTIRTFGTTSVARGGEEVAWPSHSARDLLLYLLSSPEGRRREEIIDALWHDDADAASGNRFRVTLHRLRAVLGEREAVAEQHGRYRLSPEVYKASDVHALYARLDGAERLGTRDEKVGALQDALALYSGDYLPDCAEDWADAAREEHRAAYVRASVELSMLHCDAMACEAAIQSLARALKADPYLGENYHQDLITCLSAVESKYAAVEHYRRFLKFLRDDLHDTPMPETVELAEHLKAGHAVCPHRIGTDEPCARRELLGDRCGPLLDLRVLE